MFRPRTGWKLSELSFLRRETASIQNPRGQGKARDGVGTRYI